MSLERVSHSSSNLQHPGELWTKHRLGQFPACIEKLQPPLLVTNPEFLCARLQVELFFEFHLGCLVTWRQNFHADFRGYGTTEFIFHDGKGFRSYPCDIRDLGGIFSFNRTFNDRFTIRHQFAEQLIYFCREKAVPVSRWTHFNFTKTIELNLEWQILEPLVVAQIEPCHRPNVGERNASFNSQTADASVGLSGGAEGWLV